MTIRVTYADGLNWRDVPNTVKKKRINGSFLHTLKATKKVKRRTKVLNIKLNNRTLRKSYRWYIKTKTIVLRNITDNDDTEDDGKTCTLKKHSENNASLELQCSSQSEDVSISSCNSDSDNDSDCIKPPKKLKSKKRKKSTAGSHSSEPMAKRKKNITGLNSSEPLTKKMKNITGLNSSEPLAKQKKNTTGLNSSEPLAKKKKKHTTGSNSSAPLAKRKSQKTKNVPQADSVDHDKKQEKGLKNVKRNLTSLWDDSEDDSEIIGESSEIEQKERHEVRRKSELEDSVQLENFYNNMSANSDSENDDKTMTRSTGASPNAQEEKEAEAEEEEREKEAEEEEGEKEAEEEEEDKENEAVEEEKKEKSKDVSIGSFNSDSASDADCANLSRKQKRQKRKNKTPESQSSASLAKRNSQENRNLSQVTSVDHDRTQEKSLMNVKRNLTSLLDDFKDDSGVVGESIEFEKRDSREFRRNTELQYSVPLENFRNKTTCENTRLVSDKMSVNSDAEINDKPLMGSTEARTKSEEDAEDEDEEEKGEVKEEEEKDEVKEKQEEEEEEKGKEEEEEEEEEEGEEKGEKEEEEEVKEDEENVATALEEEEQPRTTLEESPIKKSQPVITSTEIVRSKYTIVRDEGETSDSDETSHVECPVLETSRSARKNTFSNDQEANRLRNLSPGSRRIAQRKRINLVASSSSDSQDDENSQSNRVDDNSRVDVISQDSMRIEECDESPQPSCSQIIEDPSSPEESIAQVDETNHHSEIGKSIRNQIRKQEHFHSSTPLRTIEASTKGPKNNTNNIKRTSSVRLITNDALHRKESLEKVFENVSRIENFSTSRCGEGENEQVCDNDFRPIELCEFVDREGLVATEESSTITAKDFKEFAQENGDTEIWLMEIPKSIITDGDELCGKIMAFETGKMTINGTTYRTTSRDEKSATCILRSRKKKSRFKTVNVDAVGCIVVRQEFSDKTAVPPPVQSVCEFRSIVPFPKNLKSRNPLLGLNPPNGMDDFEHGSTAKNTREIIRLTKKQKKKTKLSDVDYCFT